MMRFENILIAFALLASGCSTVDPLQRARNDFFSGDLIQADNSLRECTGIPEKNRLLCYMEKGIILHYMEEYGESARVLLKASRFVEYQDQISIKDQSTAVLVNDMTITYKGEYSERLWIHTYLMMNFMLQHRYESALVEAKQALEVYEKYPDSLEKDYFTRALIALCFENMNKPDGARIEYEKLGESVGDKDPWPDPVAPGKGELILFIAQGHIPKKISVNIVFPPANRISFPRYTASSSPLPSAVLVDGCMAASREILTDMGDVAQKSLDDRAAQYVTRQALRAWTKDAIAEKIGEKSEFGKTLARMILFITEEADTRSWETLPGSLTLVRIVLDAGSHNLEVSSNYSGTAYLEDIDIPAGGRMYRSLRY